MFCSLFSTGASASSADFRDVGPAADRFVNAVNRSFVNNLRVYSRPNASLLEPEVLIESEAEKDCIPRP
jgi:hypothetical protein